MRGLRPVLALVLLLAACGGTAGGLGFGPSTTAGPPASTAAAGTTAVVSYTTASPDVSPLTLPLAMLRVDDAGAATVGALVCNRTATEAPGVSVALQTAGGARVLGLPLSLPPFSCRLAFDPALTLEDAGIAGYGAFPLAFVMDDGTSRFDVSLTLPFDPDALAVPPAALAAYQECRATYGHEGCVARIPYNPAPDSGEVMLVLGDLRAVGPGDWEEVAVYQVADDTICRPLLEGFLGVTGPRPIGWRDAVVPEVSGTGLFAFPGVAMFLVTTAAEFARLRDDLYAYAWQDTFLAGECGNEHEGTHLVLGEVPLPTVLNEGLAFFVSGLDGSGSLTQPEVFCSPTGWRYPGEEADRPYADLDAATFSLEMMYSASCFWDYLYSEFGSQGFQAVIQGLHALQDPAFNGCGPARRSTPFLTAVVTPALGVDLGPLTEERWGFGAAFTGCENL